MVTYAIAVFSGGNAYAIIKIDDAGPSYAVIAVCTSEADATAITAALS